MKNLKCKLPDASFEENLYMHFKGKVSAMMYFIITLLILFVVHLQCDISQWWTLIITVLFLVYIIIPTTWYMKNVKRFFCGSFIGIFATSLVCYYTSSLSLINFLSEVNDFYQISISSFTVLSVMILIYLFFVTGEIYDSKRDVEDIAKLESCLKKSIFKQNKTKIFNVKTWIELTKVEDIKTYSKHIISIMLVLTVPVVILGYFGGHPVNSMKMIPDKQFYLVASFIFFIVMFIFGILMLSISMKELYKWLVYRKMEM